MKVIEMTDAEMEIPFERMEGNDEKLERAEEVVEDVLGGVSSTDESVSMEEKEVTNEGIGE